MRGIVKELPRSPLDVEQIHKQLRTLPESLPQLPLP
jgi:hypothetical protein